MNKITEKLNDTKGFIVKLYRTPETMNNIELHNMHLNKYMPIIFNILSSYIVVYKINECMTDIETNHSKDILKLHMPLFHGMYKIQEQALHLMLSNLHSIYNGSLLRTNNFDPGNPPLKIQIGIKSLAHITSSNVEDLKLLYSHVYEQYLRPLVGDVINMKYLNNFIPF